MYYSSRRLLSASSHAVSDEVVGSVKSVSYSASSSDQTLSFSKPEEDESSDGLRRILIQAFMLMVNENKSER